MRHRRWWLAVAVLLVGALVLSLPRFYRVRAIGSDADLFWTSEEALVFIRDVRVGYIRNIAVRLRDSGLALFYVPPEPQDVRTSLKILRVTRAGTDHYSFSIEGFNPDGLLRVIDNQLYLGIQWRWSGTTFEATSASDRDELKGKESRSGNYVDESGWSHRCCLLRAIDPTNVQLRLGGNDRVLVFTPGDDWVSVDVVQPPSPLPQRVWSLDQQPRNVSRDDYMALFRR